MREELAFAGGLFEGEGCFTSQTYHGRWMRQPKASIVMKDEDPVRRFHAAVGFGVFAHEVKSGECYYRWGGYGFEKVQALAAMLWPWLGERRRQRVTAILQAYRKDYNDREDH